MSEGERWPVIAGEGGPQVGWWIDNEDGTVTVDMFPSVEIPDAVDGLSIHEKESKK